MPSDEMQSIDPRALGRRLQEARKARGLTQQDAADSLELARTTITALEKGDRQTRPSELIRLASPLRQASQRFRRTKGTHRGLRRSVPHCCRPGSL